MVTHSSLIVGTYTEALPHVDGHADGVLSARFVSDDGSDNDTVWAGAGVESVVTAAVVRNPTWLDTTRAGEYVYSVIEVDNFEGSGEGGLASFARDEDGTLTFLNSVPSGGSFPAHVAVDPSARFVLVANYGSGNVAVFERADDGGIGARTDVVAHHGSGPNLERQQAAHAHQVLFDPVTSALLVCDLGSDTLFSYDLTSDGRLIEREGTRIVFRPGSGPRHAAFHPNARNLFVISELASTLTAFVRDGNSFTVTDTASTLPADFDRENWSAAIQVSRSGRLVFGSNRGHDSISVFAFDEVAGTLELVQTEPTRGDEPRDIHLSPDGRFLLAANQDSDDIATFAVDEAARRVTFIGSTAVMSPAFVCFVN